MNKYCYELRRPVASQQQISGEIKALAKPNCFGALLWSKVYYLRPTALLMHLHTTAWKLRRVTLSVCSALKTITGCKKPQVQIRAFPLAQVNTLLHLIHPSFSRDIYGYDRLKKNTRLFQLFSSKVVKRSLEAVMGNVRQHSSSWTDCAIPKCAAGTKDISGTMD